MPEIDAHDTIMSNSNDALVGAAGMNARKRGLSHEITDGREHLAVETQHVRGVVAGRADQRGYEGRELVGCDGVVERNRVERQPIAHVVEHGIGDALGALVEAMHVGETLCPGVTGNGHRRTRRA